MKNIQKYTVIVFCITMLFTVSIQAQVKVSDQPLGANPVNPDAVLEVESVNKGLLMPRIALTATTNAAPLSAHVEGMFVYNTATTGDVTPGNYYNDGTQWVKVGGAPTAAPLNVIYQTGNYTATVNDDIILYTNNTVGTTLTLPTSGVVVGKKIFVSNIGSNDVQLNPLPRETAMNRLITGQSNILMYTGDPTSPWSIISGY